MKAFLCTAIVLIACQSAWAGCCRHCGCDCECQKVCRVICETKKVPKVTYDCECEDFCIPGKSCRSTVCDECGCKQHVYTPTCGKVRTRTKLVKKEEMKEKCVYKWVVEDLCCGCAQKCAAADHAAAQHDPELAARMANPPASGLAASGLAASAPSLPASFFPAQQVGFEQAAAAVETAAGAGAPKTADAPKSKFSLQRIFRFGSKD